MLSQAPRAWFWKQQGRRVPEVYLICLVEFVLLLPRTFIICQGDYLGGINRLISIGPLRVSSWSRHHSWSIRAEFTLVVVVNRVVKPFLVDRGARRLLTLIAFRRICRFILVNRLFQWVKVGSKVVIKNFILLAYRLAFTLMQRVRNTLDRLFIAFIKIIPQRSLHTSSLVRLARPAALVLSFGLDRGSSLFFFRTSLERNTDRGSLLALTSLAICILGQWRDRETVWVYSNTGRYFFDRVIPNVINRCIAPRRWIQLAILRSLFSCFLCLRLGGTSRSLDWRNQLNLRLNRLSAVESTFLIRCRTEDRRSEGLFRVVFYGSRKIFFIEVYWMASVSSPCAGLQLFLRLAEILFNFTLLCWYNSRFIWWNRHIFRTKVLVNDWVKVGFLGQ